MWQHNNNEIVMVMQRLILGAWKRKLICQLTCQCSQMKNYLQWHVLPDRRREHKSSVAEKTLGWVVYCNQQRIMKENLMGQQQYITKLLIPLGSHRRRLSNIFCRMKVWFTFHTNFYTQVLQELIFTSGLLPPLTRISYIAGYWKQNYEHHVSIPIH